MHVAVSIMVGQAMGSKRPDLAAYATKSVLHIAFVYMGCMAVVFLLFPETFFELFRTRGDVMNSFGPVVDMGVILLRYVAAFTLIDAVAIIYIGGLKGAGDTRFIMITISVASLFCIVLPILGLNYLGVMGLHGPWACLLLYVLFLASTVMYRFRKGPWREIKVIDN